MRLIDAGRCYQNTGLLWLAEEKEDNSKVNKAHQMTHQLFEFLHWSIHIADGFVVCRVLLALSAEKVVSAVIALVVALVIRFISFRTVSQLFLTLKIPPPIQLQSSPDVS